MNESSGILSRGPVTAIIDRNRILNNGECGINADNTTKIENEEILLQRKGSTGNAKNTC